MRKNPRDDQGFSLIDVMVSSAIMSVVLAVVLTATIQIYSGTNQIDQTAAARDQVDISFRRLDRELRYAMWVAPPVKISGKWFMEYALPQTEITVNGAKKTVNPCRQLTLDADGVLALAGWNLPDETAPNPPTTLATGVNADGIPRPFDIIAPNTQPFATASAGTVGVGTAYAPGFQQVRLRFNVQTGKVTMPFDSVFTSLNIDKPASLKSSDCKQR